MKNILELLEKNALCLGNKTAFADVNAKLTYSELLDFAKRTGTALSSLGCKNKPVAVYFDKSVKTIAAMLGVVYSGNFYVIIDSDMPVERIKRIIQSLEPVAIITDEKYFESAKLLGAPSVHLIGKLLETVPDEAALNIIRRAQIDTDPLYALYTSGSTGIPKGVVINHRNVLSYSEWAVGEFDFNEKTVFGNQTPFYFSMSVTDIYSTLRAGATLVIIPKMYFTFPIKLIELLNDYKVNTIYWVPSAMAIVSAFKLFDETKPEYIKKVLFAGEVMPSKHLNYWIKSLGKDVLYANLFGPTETTDICTYYVVDREFSNSEVIPIGKQCNNCDVFILASDGKAASRGEEGELYVRGSFLSAGYYNNPEKTSEVFVQNPLNTAYPERVYKTGDLAYENENGELIYIGRSDFQIKKMGYRIELGEIEAAAYSVSAVRECACAYSAEEERITLFYTASGGLKADSLMSELKQRLNIYLLPDKVVKLESMPHNQNGKIDRQNLKGYGD